MVTAKQKEQLFEEAFMLRQEWLYYTRNNRKHLAEYTHGRRMGFAKVFCILGIDNEYQLYELHKLTEENKQ